jgi:hypothetical protein
MQLTAVLPAASTTLFNSFCTMSASRSPKPYAEDICTTLQGKPLGGYWKTITQLWAFESLNGLLFSKASRAAWESYSRISAHVRSTQMVFLSPLEWVENAAESFLSRARVIDGFSAWTSLLRPAEPRVVK